MAIPHALTGPFGLLGRVCRLGLAPRGDGRLTTADIHLALDRGINFLNWCGTPNALSQVVAGLGERRRQVLICVQFEARTAAAARRELDHILEELKTDYVDILTFYYVEETAEWAEIISSAGAMNFCRQNRDAGRVRMLGLTTHQRPLAAQVSRSGHIDMVMIRYNAAHRGAETEVFPATTALGIPVVVYTCLRWGALLRPTPDDPPGFVVPRAPAWYRFALQNPAVNVALMAPANRDELEEDLSVLDAAALTSAEYLTLAQHGRRVREHAGQFP